MIEITVASLPLLVVLPPPETLTELVTVAGALLATFTLKVMGA
jgi:hypothetical protein